MLDLNLGIFEILITHQSPVNGVLLRERNREVSFLVVIVVILFLLLLFLFFLLLFAIAISNHFLMEYKIKLDTIIFLEVSWHRYLNN